jgi:hypothetical protein
MLHYQKQEKHCIDMIGRTARSITLRRIDFGQQPENMSISPKLPGSLSRRTPLPMT